MKKIIAILITLVFAVGFSLSAFAEEALYYTFEGGDSLQTVTNTLSDGGNAVFVDGFDGKALSLDGTYGLKLGDVGSSFTVSALVKISSTGGTNTIFFKNMGSSSSQKWTGVLSNAGKPSFWTHGDGFKWSTVASGSVDMSAWSHITYVEADDVGSLYVNGELIGSGSVASGEGSLYLGVTYWSADSVKGLFDEVKLYNIALSQSEVMEAYEQYVDFENAITLPGDVISDIELVDRIASKTVTWTTSDETVITTTGKVTRHDEDKSVTLTASIDAKVIGEFTVNVLKKPVNVNDKVILSYTFDENDGEIIYDKSGNGNHGAGKNGLSVNENGAVFDGSDNYIQMPEGVLYGKDDITIITTFTPGAAQKHVFLYCFGNTSDTGYMFLNPSSPGTNTLCFAITKSNGDSEKNIVSPPGIRLGEEATVVITLKGEYASMYVNGDLVMDGELGIKVSDLGKTTSNYIGKSLYAGDPYFSGVISEFTVLNYCMKEADIKAGFGTSAEYAAEPEAEEYITSVSFENGIDVKVDTMGRDDVRIAAIVLDENNNIVEFSVAEASEKLDVTMSGTVVVFAYNEEVNTPGRIYVKGQGDGFTYEYTFGQISLVCEKDYKSGMVIVAGYDVTGALTGVAFKICDINSREAVVIKGEFKNAVTFKMMYWENLAAKLPSD